MTFGLTARRLLWSRFLTRCGDHAWSLALPLAILQVYPGTLRPLALYYLATRAVVVLLMPHFGAWLDRTDRLVAVRRAITVQACGVALAGLFFVGMEPAARQDGQLLAWLVLAGIGTSIGSAIMNVGISLDWIPAAFAPAELPAVNSRLKQIDLVTEVGAPVAAGLVMSLGGASFLGILLVAGANAVSFVFEYVLLGRVYGEVEALRAARRAHVGPAEGILSTIARHRDVFLAQPAALLMIAGSLLWFTVLTPHGDLITGFLKSHWAFDDRDLGLVRGAGAAVGILPTLFYSAVSRRLGTGRTAAVCITEQTLCLLVACAAFHVAGGAHAIFIGALLLSRVGLYGFYLAQVQICQETIREDVRGQVGGFSWSINNLATLTIYLVALFFADPASFPVLGWLSAAAVGLGAVLTWVWLRRQQSSYRAAAPLSTRTL